MSALERDEAVRALWRRGSYEVAGDWFADASRDVLTGLEGRLGAPGATALDVACGTGTVAIAAARLGARVTGVDLTPELLDVARRRAVEAGVEVSFVPGSFEALGGLGRAAFDVVASSFGVMFALDPAAVAAQLAEVCRPDGAIAVAAPHPDGAFGPLPTRVRAMFPGPAVEIHRWADPDQVAAFFAGTGFAVADSRAGRVGIPFASAAAALQAFRTHSGPWNALFERLESTGRAAESTGILLEHLAERADPHPDGIALRVDYVVTHLRPHGHHPLPAVPAAGEPR